MGIDNLWICIIVGLLCGIISGFGIGGGSLLMVWMTAVASLDQRVAQGINLIYFMPTAVCALFFHFKNKMICKEALIPAIICGCITGIIFAGIANAINIDVLKKLFGGFLCVVGFKELLYKTKRST